MFGVVGRGADEAELGWSSPAERLMSVGCNGLGMAVLGRGEKEESERVASEEGRLLAG